MKMFYQWGHIDSTEGKVLALNMADPDLIPDIPCSPLSPHRSDS